LIGKRDWGLAITATRMTITIPAIRVRTSPVFTYSTGYRALKKPPDNHGSLSADEKKSKNNPGITF
jgi:hypothetical protein